MTQQHTCPICRERHDETRRLSFDGKGINSCGSYRSRLATFQNPTTERDLMAYLGPIFAAAPALLSACEAAETVARLAEFPSSELAAAGDRLGALAPQLRAALAAAKGGAQAP